jgi:plastocyanin
MRRLTAIVALCAMPLYACGDGGEEEGSRPVTVPAGGKVRVVGDEYSFAPETVVVKGAGPLTITLRNEGDLAHNLRVFRGEEDVGGTPTFTGGRTESGRVNLEHGRFEMICTVGDHADLGMTGTIEVR